MPDCKYCGESTDYPGHGPIYDDFSDGFCSLSCETDYNFVDNLPEQVRRDGKTYIQVPCREDNCTRQDQLLLSETDDVYRLYCAGCGTHQDRDKAI